MSHTNYDEIIRAQITAAKADLALLSDAAPGQPIIDALRALTEAIDALAHKVGVPAK